MRILVTGGAGFAGSCFVREAIGGNYSSLAGADITVLDKLTYAGRRANLNPVQADPRFRFALGDIGDADLLDQLLPGCEAVVNFAAETHVDRSIADATEFVSTNVLATSTLFDRCARHGVGRVVHVSTDEVYGSITDGAFTEADRLAPSSPYSASKAAADLMAHAYWVTHGLPVVVTRCENNYGPYQFPEKLIPRFVTNLIGGKPLPLYGDGEHVRSWLHVSDHCRAIALVLESGRAGEIYNVAGDTRLTNRELTRRLLEATGKSWDDSVMFVADRKGHDRRYALDDGKIRAELGYRPEVAFDDGLAATITWYREHRQWWETLI